LIFFFFFFFFLGSKGIHGGLSKILSRITNENPFLLV